MTGEEPGDGDVVRRDRFSGGPARGFLSSMAADERIFDADLAVDRAHVVMLDERGVVPADDALVMKEILEKLGAPVKLEYYPDQGHTWLMVDKDLPGVFDWFDGRKLNRYPKNFSYAAPFGVFKTRIYWAEIMPFEATQPVNIAVSVKSKKSVEIEARNIKKIVLKPDKSILDVSGKLNIKANKEVVDRDSNKDTNEVIITF